MSNDPRLATPEELADMFGVTDLTDVSDTLYEDYVTWMEDGGIEDDDWERDAHRWTPPEHPTIEGGTWAVIEEAEDPRRGPIETGCDPGAPTEGHLVGSEEEADEDETGLIIEVHPDAIVVEATGEILVPAEEDDVWTLIRVIDFQECYPSATWIGSNDLAMKEA